MQENYFPALYRSANELSQEYQRYFFRALGLHLFLLTAAAILSIVNIPQWPIPMLQLLTLLGALACSIYLFGWRPDRYWYASRAVAESIKTITWRYMCRAEPFQGEDAAASGDFRQKVRAIVDQNRDVAEALNKYLGESQITDLMMQMRNAALEERKSTYASNRIQDQLTWYAKKSTFNKRVSRLLFLALISANFVAVFCATLRIKFVEVQFWPTDIFVAIAACLLSWMQAKRFSELAASYALATHEIGFIREQALLPTTAEEFSQFVGDAENAFSREHTQWVARQDV